MASSGYDGGLTCVLEVGNLGESKFDGPTNEIAGMVKLATSFDPDSDALMFYEDLRKKH